MKRYLVIGLILVLLCLMVTIPAFGIDYIYRIAVLPFDDGSIKEHWWDQSLQLGNAVSDQLITALFETKRFRIIEREQIEAILKEQNFGKEGYLDPKTAAKIGKILGVQYLVIGRVTGFSQKTENGVLGSLNANNPMGMVINNTISRAVIDARIVDTTTAEILTTATGDGERKNVVIGTATKKGLMVFGSKDLEKSDMGKALHIAVNEVAYGLANTAYDGVTIPGMTIGGKVAYVGQNKLIINIGAKDGVANGMVFIVNHTLDLVKDPETGEVVDVVTEPVAEIMVTEVKERTATCIIASKLNSKYEITVKDLVQTKEPLKVAPLAPLNVPSEPELKKSPSKLYVDMSLFDCNNHDLFGTDKKTGTMSMWGGDLYFGTYKISGERVITSSIDPNSKVDITEYKIGYDLQNDGETKMIIYVGNLFIHWSGANTVVNSSLMLGVDVSYDMGENTSFDGSFGYGCTPDTTVNNVKESSWTNITVIKGIFSYALSDQIDVYAGYRSYLISRQDDQSLQGYMAGVAVKF